ncbi:MAG: DUF6090 family protein [Bacteroidota bacterium]
MIKFLRHFRKKLLEENRFSKYLLYAIGEIILVVIGILIALQINTWNEQKKSRRTERLYLSEIKSGLQSDSNQITDILAFNVEKVKIVKGLMGIFSDTLTNSQRFEMIDRYSVPFTDYQTFTPNRTAWKNLVASESLNLIQDRELRTTLMEYYDYDYASSVQERIRSMNRKVIDENYPRFFTKEYVLEKLQISTELPSLDENQIYLNQTFLSDLYGIIYLINVQNQGLQDTNTTIDKAVNLIDVQLKEL